MVKDLSFANSGGIILKGFDTKIKEPNLKGLFNHKKSKKRKTLTPAQKLYIWERPKIYGRTCYICHERILKQSDLEFDHKRAFSKGGTKLALVHKDCNRLKASGSLSKIQKTLGIRTIKKKRIKKRHTQRKPQNSLGINFRPPKVRLGI